MLIGAQAEIRRRRILRARPMGQDLDSAAGGAVHERPSWRVAHVASDGSQLQRLAPEAAAFGAPPGGCAVLAAPQPSWYKFPPGSSPYALLLGKSSKEATTGRGAALSYVS